MIKKVDDCEIDPQLEAAFKRDATRRERPKYAAGGIPIWEKRVKAFPDFPVSNENKADVKATNPKDVIGIRKAPMSTVPANVMAEVGVAMLEGAKKYGRHNYRLAGVSASVYYDGTMRHLMDWWEGNDIDSDSGLSEITKAITSLVVLRDAMMQGMWTDDRPPSAKAFRKEMNAKAAEVIDKYAHLSPVHYTIVDTGKKL